MQRQPPSAMFLNPFLCPLYIQSFLSSSLCNPLHTSDIPSLIWVKWLITHTNSISFFQWSSEFDVSLKIYVFESTFFRDRHCRIFESRCPRRSGKSCFMTVYLIDIQQMVHLEVLPFKRYPFWQKDNAEKKEWMWVFFLFFFGHVSIEPEIVYICVLGYTNSRAWDRGEFWSALGGRRTCQSGGFCGSIHIPN